ncbi:AMP-binding protein [Prochlorococcus sp. MIT 1341]|uniref:AMP-binding protein n=1 Tax=Prochlorococcus sp. MIT 1341 TaxID=3096221 RepID=UPI002A758A0E|nr:AMP-binding protein [Prochlorococcus sp. MIT 1341]
MSNLVLLECNPKHINLCIEKLFKELKNGSWVHLLPYPATNRLITRDCLPLGPGVVVASGGSSGSRKYCLQPCRHLDRSANATASWLGDLGINPKDCVIFNPLPLHHVSGLMPLWRSKSWGVKYVSLSRELMHDPALLEEFCRVEEKDSLKPRLLSLVPTQLARLMSDPFGMKWLKRFSVIWVGGDKLSKSLEELARLEGLLLAPCYGSTETAAMVTALSPKDFLAGKTGCGSPLSDVELRLSNDGTLLIRTSRLAISSFTEHGVQKPCSIDGWWRSADKAQLEEFTNKVSLKIIGRIDFAVHSGGETVFPEQLEQRLFKLVREASLPIENLLLLPKKDDEWGHRLAGLVRLNQEQCSYTPKVLFQKLFGLIEDWLPAEKPTAWYLCPSLSRTEAGKWDRAKWMIWLRENS